MTSQARRNRVAALWLNLPETWRTLLVSAFKTFVSDFAVSLSYSIVATGGIEWDSVAIGAALVVAFRAGFSAVTNKVLVRTLPDPKK